MAFRSSFRALVRGLAAVGVGALLLCSGGVAGAEEPRPVSNAEMQAATRAYYEGEMATSFLFMGYGAVTGGAGAAALTVDGDFARGFGLSSLILGATTALGGVGYGVAVKVRGDYYNGLAASDPARFKREEEERIGGTNSRFVLYLGSELLLAAAGIGVAAYGVAAKEDLYTGLGIGGAIQGIGLFVIDAPGAGRADRYRDVVRRFTPQVGVSPGGNGRPWAMTLTRSF